MKRIKKSFFYSILSIGTIASIVPMAAVLVNNQKHIVNQTKSNGAFKNQALGNFVVPTLINSSLHGTVPEFNVNNLRVSESLKAKWNNSVTKEDAYNIIVRNQIPLFGTSLGNDKLVDKLDKNTLTISNNYSYNLVTFELKGIIVNQTGTIGNKQYQLCLYGFKPEVNYLYIGLIVSIPSVILILFLTWILFLLFKKRKKYKFKSEYVVIDNELIDTTRN